MIRDATYTLDLGAVFAPNGGKVGMEAGTKVPIDGRFAVFRAEDDVDDDLAEGLRHGDYEARFQRLELLLRLILGRCPRLV